MSGPYIVLLGCDSAQCIWRASVMIVTPPARGAVLPAEPSLMLSDQGVPMPAMASDPCHTDTSILQSKHSSLHLLLLLKFSFHHELQKMQWSVSHQRQSQMKACAGGQYSIQKCTAWYSDAQTHVQARQGTYKGCSWMS